MITNHKSQITNPPEVARGRWIVERRGPRNDVDPSRVVSAFVEPERTERGDVASVATLFLTNRECPWRCLMCDLWKNATSESVPAGAIPAQIRRALAELSEAPRIKLYNSGSFFDPKAIPVEDHGVIAALLSGFERVTVESHPALVGDACWRFHDFLAGDLEVAMGLETIHRESLEALNKGMTFEDYRHASERLLAHGVAVRAFVLLGLPFLSRKASLEWTCRSIEAALDLGVTAISVIPTRTGNGALESLQAIGQFEPPDISALEAATAFGVARGRARVFADLWEISRLRRCSECFPVRVERLHKQNLNQRVAPSTPCDACGSGS